MKLYEGPSVQKSHDDISKDPDKVYDDDSTLSDDSDIEAEGLDATDIDCRRGYSSSFFSNNTLESNVSEEMGEYDSTLMDQAGPSSLPAPAPREFGTVFLVDPTVNDENDPNLFNISENRHPSQYNNLNGVNVNVQPYRRYFPGAMPPHMMAPPLEFVVPNNLIDDVDLYQDFVSDLGNTVASSPMHGRNPQNRQFRWDIYVDETSQSQQREGIVIRRNSVTHEEVYYTPLQNHNG